MEPFPKDVWSHLIPFFDLSTLNKFLLTCKTHYDHCSKEEFWKHKFESKFGTRFCDLHNWRMGYKLQLNTIQIGSFQFEDDDLLQSFNYRIDLTDLNPYVDHDCDDNDKDFVNFFCDMFIKLENLDRKLKYKYENEAMFKQIKQIFQPYFKFYDDIDEGGIVFITNETSIGCHEFDKKTTYEFQIGSKLYQEIINVLSRD